MSENLLNKAGIGNVFVCDFWMLVLGRYGKLSYNIKKPIGKFVVNYVLDIGVNRMIRIEGISYEVVTNHREGWNADTFKERFNDILCKYDYIVGDWGYGQLRLKGFYEKDNTKVPKESNISTLDEYILEYCNFGCPYFVLKKSEEKHQK